MTITLASCTERLACVDIDPMLIGFCVELSPKRVSKGAVALDIPGWVEYVWHHADQYLRPHGRLDRPRRHAQKTFTTDKDRACS